MTLEADLLLDRRRLKRRLSLWRTLALVAALALLAGALLPGEGGGILPQNLPAGLAGGHVARLPVEGFISDDRRTLELLDRAGRDPRVRAVIVSIDSPGGSVAGGEGLHTALLRLRERKPVVAVMGGTAASAGYMVALPAHRIFAREATVTGSIGVLLQSFDASELLARIGVRAEVLPSGPFKAQPSPLQPLTEEGRAELMRLVRDLHAQFVAMVAAGRSMPEEQVRPLADGRVFTGRQALAAGLLDAIGGEAEARAWLADARGVPASLPVRELERRSFTERTFGLALQGVVKTVISEWLGVDGVRALWQLRS
jgi:protease IV